MTGSANPRRASRSDGRSPFSYATNPSHSCDTHVCTVAYVCTRYLIRKQKSMRGSRLVIESSRNHASRFARYLLVVVSLLDLPSRSKFPKIRLCSVLAHDMRVVLAWDYILQIPEHKLLHTYHVYAPRHWSSVTQANTCVTRNRFINSLRFRSMFIHTHGMKRVNHLRNNDFSITFFCNNDFQNLDPHSITRARAEFVSAITKKTDDFYRLMTTCYKIVCNNTYLR